MIPHGPCQGWHSGRWSDDQCRVCYIARNRRTFRGSAETPRPSRRPPPRVALPTIQTFPATCYHRGEVATRPTSCHKTWTYRCGVFGSCTVAQCETCTEHASDVVTDYRRHLCYYVYPVKGNDLWKTALDNLTSRLSLFNGRRVVAIALPPTYLKHQLVPPNEVVDYFGRGDADFMFVPHGGTRKLGEVTAFVPMLSRIERFTKPTDVTFYGHTKGATKSPDDASVHRWADLMYKANLDQWDRVQESLVRYPITGAFRKVGRAFGGKVTSHYTGTFFWFRNADVFSRASWKTLDQRYGGTEMWPGRLFSDDEIGCHFFDATGSSLYDPRTITRIENLYAEHQRTT